MFTFQEAQNQPLERVGTEAQKLGELGAQVGRGFVLDKGFEEEFYSSNNLPERIRKLFKDINARRIDEDALERASSGAGALLREASLMDNAVQKILLAVKNSGLLEQTVLVRRELTALESPALEACGPRGAGNEVLFALKKLWAQVWSFDAALERLDNTGTYALEARPTLFVAGAKPEWNPARATELGVAGVLEWKGSIVGVLTNSPVL